MFFFRQMLELFLCIKFVWGSYRSWMKKTESYGSLSLKNFKTRNSPVKHGIFKWISKNKSLNSLSICQLLAQEFVSYKIPFSTVSLGQMLGCSGTSRVVPILTSLRRERPCGRKIGIEPFCDKMLSSEDSRFMVLYMLSCSNSVAIQRILMYSAHFSDNLVSPCSGLNCFLTWWFFWIAIAVSHLWFKIGASLQKYHSRQISRISVRKKISSSRFLLPVMELLQPFLCVEAPECISLWLLCSRATWSCSERIWYDDFNFIEIYMYHIILKWVFQQQRTRMNQGTRSRGSN